MTHCRREVLQAQWEILLDDEFLEAYKHGLVIVCCDGVMRRFYPRILTYSADYLEKYVMFTCPFVLNYVLIKCRIILACIRNKGNCPCPRCLIPLKRVQNLGQIRDRKERRSLARVDDDSRRHQVDLARGLIYEKGYVVNSVLVERILKNQSLTPTVVGANDSVSSLLKLTFDLECFLSKTWAPRV